MSSSRKATYMAPPVLPACKFTKIRSNMPANGLKNVRLTQFTVLGSAFAIMPKQAAHRPPAFWKGAESAILPIAQKDARKNAARCNARCSALR